MMHHFYGPGSNFMTQANYGWMGVASMVIHLLVWVVVIYFAVKIINKYLQKENGSKVKEDTAMTILRERYARGEIESEEFMRRKAELE